MYKRQLVDKYADNVLTISGGEFSTNGRGAVVSLTDNLSIAEDTTKTSIMAFAFDARALKDGGSGRLYLLDNNTNTDDNGASRDTVSYTPLRSIESCTCKRNVI